MSIEIEVGLENATRIPISPEPPKPVAAKGFANPRVQKLLVAGGIVALLVVAALLFYYHDRESTDDAQVDGHITPIAAKISGRVQEVLVTDNQAVKAGQILLKIDPRDYQAAVDQAQAALDVAESDATSAGADVPRTKADVASGNSSADAQLLAAEANLEQAQTMYDQAQTADLAYAQANIDKSHANAEFAKADLARYKPLLDKGEISKQQYDSAQANADATNSALRADQEKLAQANRNVEVTKSQVAAAKARVEQARAGVLTAHADSNQVTMRSADARSKLAKVEQARAALDAAKLNLSYTEVVAPIDGVATHKQVETGQIVQIGQGLAGGRAAAGRLGHRKFQRDAVAQHEAWAKSGSESGYLRKDIQRPRGFDRRSYRLGAEFAAPGKCHGKLRESSAAHAGKNRAGSDPAGKSGASSGYECGRHGGDRIAFCSRTQPNDAFERGI